MAIEQYMWIIWLSVFVLSLIIEAVGTDLVTIWFAVGSLLALILSFIEPVPFWTEIIVFFVVSIACLLLVRPLARKYLRGQILKSNADGLVGRKGVLLEKIDAFHRGAVQIGDVRWTCVGLDDNSKIEEGKVVEIVAISGNKLIVREANGPAEGE